MSGVWLNTNPWSSDGKESRMRAGRPGAKRMPVPNETAAVQEPRRLNSTSTEPRFVEKIMVGASGGGTRMAAADAAAPPRPTRRQAIRNAAAGNRSLSGRPACPGGRRFGALYA
jgi:hypothetical protein